jgi:hypothetical protein
MQTVLISSVVELAREAEVLQKSIGSSRHRGGFDFATSSFKSRAVFSVPETSCDRVVPRAVDTFAIV